MSEKVSLRSAFGFVNLPGKIIDDDMDTLYEVLKACKMRYDSMRYG
jgi:hypothetical protein